MYGWFGVANRVGDQLAHDEFCGHGQVPETPGFHLARRPGPDFGDGGGVHGNVPRDDMVGTQGVRARQEEGNVVGLRNRHQLLHRGRAQVGEVDVRLGQHLAESGHAQLHVVVDSSMRPSV